MKRSAPGRKSDNRDDDYDDDDDDAGIKRDSKSVRSSVSVSRSATASADSDVRRAMRWVSFAKPKSVIGFEHLSPAEIPAMTAKPRGIAVVLDNVVGWKMPRIVDKLYNEDDYDMSVQLSMSLFHLTTGSFFGSTWIGGQLSPSSGDVGSNASSDFECRDVVYLISRITDPTCIAIMEIIITKYQKGSNLAVAQYGCGWTILNLFSTELKDLMDSSDNASEFIMVLFSFTFVNLSCEWVLMHCFDE
jgi:hypothetical protein